MNRLKPSALIAIAVGGFGLIYLIQKKTAASTTAAANPDYNLSNEILAPTYMTNAGGSVGSYPLAVSGSTMVGSGIGGTLLVGTPNGANFTQIGPGLALSESYDAGNRTYTPYEPLGLPSAQPTIYGV